MRVVGSKIDALSAILHFGCNVNAVGGLQSILTHGSYSNTGRENAETIAIGQVIGKQAHLVAVGHKNTLRSIRKTVLVQRFCGTAIFITVWLVIGYGLAVILANTMKQCNEMALSAVLR